MGNPAGGGGRPHARKPEQKGPSTEPAAQVTGSSGGSCSSGTGLSPESPRSVLTLGLSAPALAAWADQTALLSLPVAVVAWPLVLSQCPSLPLPVWVGSRLLCDLGEGGPSSRVNPEGSKPASMVPVLSSVPIWSGWCGTEAGREAMRGSWHETAHVELHRPYLAVLL